MQSTTPKRLAFFFSFLCFFLCFFSGDDEDDEDEEDGERLEAKELPVSPVCSSAAEQDGKGGGYLRFRRERPSEPLSEELPLESLLLNFLVLLRGGSSRFELELDSLGRSRRDSRSSSPSRQPRLSPPRSLRWSSLCPLSSGLVSLSRPPSSDLSDLSMLQNRWLFDHWL